MKAHTILITGASSGLGREMALRLVTKCSKMIIVGRNRERLDALKEELIKARDIKARDIKVTAVATDLSIKENCISLHDEFSDVDLLINDAGFGDYGDFDKTSPDKDLRMIDTNVKALHILTKLYLADMIRRDHGHILNVASIAGFMPGPLMATYYATKAYVTSLTRAVSRELKERGSDIYVGALCPGPVDTEFNDVADVEFALKGISPKKCVSYALDQMINHRRTIIVPTLRMKAATFGSRFLPSDQIVAMTGRQQKKKKNL